MHIGEETRRVVLDLLDLEPGARVLAVDHDTSGEGSWRGAFVSKKWALRTLLCLFTHHTSIRKSLVTIPGRIREG